MSEQVIVEHILIERLERYYAKTLYGRFIYHPAAILGKYFDLDYFKQNHPDCQDCLRKHFSKQRRKP